MIVSGRPRRVLVAMSGGVDSSVAAALLGEQGFEVVGATMKLWGGASDSGCCSVADVEDARRVAEQLGIRHHVFNFTGDFEARVVEPYVSAHARGLTPNPCVECNRHLKFDRFLERALKLGFDSVATGHHARVAGVGAPPGGPGVAGGGPAGPARARWVLRRGRDQAKDQSYVLSMLGQHQLARCLFPVGELTKAEVRERARRLGLRTAGKPDSQDVCFVTASGGGRAAFLDGRLGLHPGRVVDARSGAEVGRVPAVELVTVGQRKGLGAVGPSAGSPSAGSPSLGGSRRYALAVDVASATVTVGREEDLVAPAVGLDQLTWTGWPAAPGTPVLAQASAHGAPLGATFTGEGIVWDRPRRRVAPGQTVALYDAVEPDVVLGAGIALPSPL